MNIKTHYIKRIEGYESYSITSEGEVANHKSGRFLKQSNHTDGYKVVRLAKGKRSKLFYVHRLVATAFLPTSANESQVDHIDRNRSNNNLENLRWVSRSVNHQNRTKQGHTTSEYLGVSWNKVTNKWVAMIQRDKKNRYLGSYTCEVEAAHAYIAAANAYSIKATASGFSSINNSASS
jgi:hypothetical protein